MPVEAHAGPAQSAPPAPELDKIPALRPEGGPFASKSLQFVSDKVGLHACLVHISRHLHANAVLCGGLADPQIAFCLHV